MVNPMIFPAPMVPSPWQEILRAQAKWICVSRWLASVLGRSLPAGRSRPSWSFSLLGDVHQTSQPLVDDRHTKKSLQHDYAAMSWGRCFLLKDGAQDLQLYIYIHLSQSYIFIMNLWRLLRCSNNAKFKNNGD